MKGRKVYLFFVVILSVLLFFQTITWSDRMGQVDTFRGARLEGSVLNPLISRNLNKLEAVKLAIDGEPIDSENGELVLDSDMQVLASMNLARNVFYCSARVKDKDILVIERNDDTFSFKMNEKMGKKNAKSYDLAIAPKKIGQKVYMSLNDLCRLFGYGYSWDKESKTANLDSSSSEKPTLRESYDLRKEGRVSKIKNQGNLSTCWAYAAASALESSLLPEETDTFSAEDMSERNTYGIPADKPGNYMMAVSYLVSWIGPIQGKGGNPSKHVQEVHFYGRDDIEDIKWAIFRNGGVSTSIYAETNAGNLNESDYYNRAKSAYYYYGGKNPNHDVVIVGWDDNYSKDNFGHACPGDGAFICQNSWGESFGENGAFYVSYYDSNVGKFGVSYVKIESNTNYDRIYQSDLCGEIGTAGYDTKKSYGANVYTASNDEVLKACGFFATSKDMAYNVYAVPEYRDTMSFSDRILVASGSMHETGFYTVPFNQDISVNEGQRFAVVLELTSQNKGNQVAIEYDGNSLSKNVKTNDGEGYISANGFKWVRVETDFDANICLKVYADEVK